MCLGLSMAKCFLGSCACDSSPSAPILAAQSKRRSSSTATTKSSAPPAHTPAILPESTSPIKEQRNETYSPSWRCRFGLGNFGCLGPRRQPSASSWYHLQHYTQPYL